MTLMTATELSEAKTNVRELIIGSGMSAKVLRPRHEERLYSSDEGTFEDAGIIAIELNDEPKEALSGKIDATASVLPDADILAEDHIEIDERRFRVQTVDPAYFFGTITHLTLKLVQIYDR